MTSTNGRDRFLPAAPGGKSVQYTGWQEPLPDLVRRLRARIEGVRQRLEFPTTEVSLWPSAVAGHRIFTPEAGVETVNTQQTEVGGDYPVNVVVRSGKTYTIRIIHPGPGVFVGRWLKVSLWMRLHNPNLKGDTESWLPICSNTGVGSNAAASGPTPYTTNFSIFPVQPALPYYPLTSLRPPALNYFWNLQDPRNGRLYADKLASHMMLLPNTYQWGGVRGVGPSALVNTLADGDVYDLKAPWVFERDGQATFLFRPTTDFYQFASSIAGNAAPMNLPFDDRQGGIRDQSVKVQVEMHGYRFETMQDAVHAGALTHVWGDDENGADLPKDAILPRRKG